MLMTYKICVWMPGTATWADEGNYLAESEMRALNVYFSHYPETKDLLKLSDIKIQKLHCVQTTYSTGETI